MSAPARSRADRGGALSRSVWSYSPVTTTAPRQRTTGRAAADDGEDDGDGAADDGGDGGVNDRELLATEGEADTACDDGVLAAAADELGDEPADEPDDGPAEGHPQIATTSTPMKTAPVITATTSKWRAGISSSPRGPGDAEVTETNLTLRLAE